MVDMQSYMATLPAWKTPVQALLGERTKPIQTKTDNKLLNNMVGMTEMHAECASNNPYMQAYDGKE